MAGAGGPGGKEVGRITIRVVPDTTRFREALKGQLEGIERTTEAEVQVDGDTTKLKVKVKEATKDLRATVKVDANTDKAEGQLDRFQRRMLSEMESHLRTLEPKMRLTADGEHLRRDIENAAKQLSSQIKAKIPLDAELAAGQRAKVLGEVEALKKLASETPIELKFDSNFDYRLHRGLARLREKAAADELRVEQQNADAIAKLHRQLQQDKHRIRLDDMKSELRMMGLREAEARKFAENYKREMAEAHAKALAPDDGWRQKVMGDLRKAVNEADLQLPITADGERLRRDLRAKVAAIEESIQAQIPADLELAAGQRRKIRAEIESIRPEIKVDVDKSALSSARQGIGKFFQMPSFGSGMNPMAMAVIATGILAVAAPVIGLITTALLALPGLLSLILAPIAAITLGLDGFKRAAEKIKPQFEALKTVMSAAAEEQFTPVMQNLADTIFPALERSLPGVTKGLADFAQGAINAFNQGDNMQKFEGSIGRIGTALSGMAPGMQGFMSGFIGLIDQFSLKLPAITEWFNKSGQDFDAWVAKISGDGSLSTAFDNLGTTIQKILGWLGEMGGKSIEFMGDPKALDGFLETFGKIADAIQAIIDLSATLNQNWQNLVQAYRPLAALTSFLSGNLAGAKGTMEDFFNNKSFTGTQESVDGLRDSINQVGPAAAAQKDALADLLTGTAAGATGGLNELLDPLGGGVAPPKVEPPDIEPAKAKLEEYSGFVDQVTAQVTGALSQGLTGETLPAPNFEAFKAAWSGLATFVAEQVGKVKTVTSTVGADVSTGFQQAATGLATSWAGLPGIATSAFQPVVAAVTTAMSEVVTAVVTKAGEVVTEISSWPGKFVAALGDVKGSLKSAGSDLVQGLINGIELRRGDALAAAESLGVGVGAAARHALGIRSPSRVFAEIGDNVGKGLANGIDGQSDNVVNTIREVLQAIKDVFGSADGLALNFNFGAAQQQLSTLNDTTKDFRDTVATTTSGPRSIGKLSDATKSQQDMLKMEADRLEIQAKQASLDAKSAGSKDEKARLDALAAELRMQKDLLKLKSDEIGYADKYGGSMGGVNEQFDALLDKGKQMPFDFAQTTGGQLLSDLGMSGKGALPQLLEQGAKYVFNVSSIGEALTAQKTQTSKEALSYTRR